MADNKKTFGVEVNGKETAFAVLRPNNKVQQQGQLVYNRAFREAVKPSDGKPGAIVRAALEGVLRDQKLWDDAKQARWEELNKKLLDGTKKLQAGGVKLSEARALAIEMRATRWGIRQLLQDRNSLDLNTAEAQAEQARFNYFVAACTVYADTGKPYWKDEDDYLSSAADGVSAKAPSLLGNLLYNLEDNYEANLPENKFLIKYKFSNKELDLLDKQGRRIDEKGRLIDEKGRFVNEAGEYVDVDGSPVTEEGEYKVDAKPFLDDDGKPLVG